MQILVVDDHELVMRGIRAVLSQDRTLTICGEAKDGQEAVSKAKMLCPDIVVMDVTMPIMNGLEATREIKKALPKTEIIIVSQHDSQEVIRQAFAAGALGYVLKSAISADLLTAIDRVSEGQTFIYRGDLQKGATGTVPEVTQSRPALKPILPKNEDHAGQKETERQLNLLVRSLESQVEERTRALQGATEEVRELSGRLMRAQDQERRRVARELHDGIGQLLSAMSMNANVLKNESLSAEGRRALEENAALLAQSTQEVRTISQLLHPPLLEEVGLEPALEWYVEGFRNRSRIDVQLRAVPAYSAGLSMELALTLFRVVQECLINVHRHSGSNSAIITIDRNAVEIRLEVSDQGKGISQQQQTAMASGRSLGLGLTGMRERIRQFQGNLEVRSSPGDTRIAAVIPIPPARGSLLAESPESLEAIAKDTQMTKKLPTVLCIDDEDIALLTRSLMLESSGYHVIEAKSGAEGLSLFEAEDVDIVILDYWMSGMRGIAVASEMKRKKPSVPIIVLSGLRDLPGEAMGIADRWLLKGSLKPEDLLDIVQNLLGRPAL